MFCFKGCNYKIEESKSLVTRLTTENSDLYAELEIAKSKVDNNNKEIALSDKVLQRQASHIAKLLIEVEELRPKVEGLKNEIKRLLEGNHGGALPVEDTFNVLFTPSRALIDSFHTKEQDIFVGDAQEGDITLSVEGKHYHKNNKKHHRNR
jgi:predicted RNase H-like nuclease (RuvC/YqgF family)